MSDDRSWIGGGGFSLAMPGKIPWSVVRQWALHHDMTSAEFAMLDHCIQAMDGVYLEHWQKSLPPPPPPQTGA